MPPFDLDRDGKPFADDPDYKQFRVNHPARIITETPLINAPAKPKRKRKRVRSKHKRSQS